MSKSKYGFYLPLIKYYVKKKFSHTEIAKYIGEQLNLDSWNGLRDFISKQGKKDKDFKSKVAASNPAAVRNRDKKAIYRVGLPEELQKILKTPVKEVLESIAEDREKVGIKRKAKIKNTYQNEKDRTGFKTYSDGDIIINWDDETVITHLGEFGTYMCSFNKVRLIQEMYAHDGDNETAAIVAREHDFVHTNAVYLFAKKHGFTKSSGIHTDLDYLVGKMDEDKAVFQTLQRTKRNAYKRGKKEQWKETKSAADKWWDFENAALESIKSFILDQKNVKYRHILNKMKSRKSDSRYAAMFGLTDIHFMKLCYYNGKCVYNKDICKERVEKHTIGLADKFKKHGTPEEIYIIVGNDGIHVDGISHMTTRGTPQHEATDGLFRLHFRDYLKLIVDTIIYTSQIAPVKIIPVKGNHDYNMSIVMNAICELFFNEYATFPNISIIECDETRIYWQYGKTGMMACHGNEMKSIPKLESEAHKLIMGEAKLQGLNIQDIEKYLVIHGDKHVGSYQDLNGNVQRVGLPSLSDTDDYWHKEQGYMGREIQTMGLLIDHENGLENIFFIK